ncbi:MAG: hypothetical protein P8Q90_04595 [Candidatus Thalassarchaeaceae archaeon]|nr:hypothetical protein [Candidatus Thalassarchaeaceae archaeon]
MSVNADLLRLIAGLFFGIALPRIPLLFFTRFLSLERELAPHPDPIPLGVPLIQRLLLMRRVHAMCWVICILPLSMGILILKSSPEPLGVGLIAGAAWFIFSRLVPLHIERGFGVLPLSLIQEVNNFREPQADCCHQQFLQWEVRAIRCKNCRYVALDSPRPDLGRIRSDGRLLGSLRILLMDGHSVFPPNEESLVGQGVELFGKIAEEE